MWSPLSARRTSCSAKWIGRTRRIKNACCSEDAIARIDQAIAKYPADQKRSAVMAALTIAQEEKPAI